MAPTYQRWLLTDEAKEMWGEVEKETGAHYLGTFWPILGFGEYDCEDWIEVPNWAVLDKVKDSVAMDKLYQRFFDLDIVDTARSMKTRMMRSTGDVHIFEPQE
jgi:hypothetical protein